MKAFYLALILTFALMVGGCKERGTASSGGSGGGDVIVPDPAPTSEPHLDEDSTPPMPQFKTPMNLDPGA